MKIFLWIPLASTAPRPSILQIGLTDIYFFSAVTFAVPYVESILFPSIWDHSEHPETLPDITFTHTLYKDQDGRTCKQRLLRTNEFSAHGMERDGNWQNVQAEMLYPKLWAGKSDWPDKITAGNRSWWTRCQPGQRAWLMSRRESGIQRSRENLRGMQKFCTGPFRGIQQCGRYLQSGNSLGTYNLEKKKSQLYDWENKSEVLSSLEQSISFQLTIRLLHLPTDFPWTLPPDMLYCE